MNIRIQTPERTYEIPEGKLVHITWKCKYHTQSGYAVGVGWLKRGEKPHTVLLVHECFTTWDQITQEYSSKWTIYNSQIHEIRILGSVK